MMKNAIRRSVWAILCLGFLVAWDGSLRAEELDLGAAINKAGRQRMLTQRIVKAYCQIGLGVVSEGSRRQLDRALSRFADQLAELKAVAPDDNSRKSLAWVEELWDPFRRIAAGNVSRENAKRLLFMNDDLLYASHKAATALQDFADTRFTRLVNISGRQRMLSERMAKFYMLRAWGFDRLSLRDEMETAKNEFAGALAMLKSAPENTEAIRRELDAVALQWTWFQAALNMEGATSHLLIVADASEAILNGMDLITGMYQELVKD